MRYAVRHVTTTRYASPVRLARFNLRLSPADWPGQTVDQATLVIDPPPAERIERPGAYRVNITQIAINAPVTTLTVDSRFTVAVEPQGSLLADGDAPVAAVRAMALAGSRLDDLAPAVYLFASTLAGIEPDIAAWAQPHIIAHAGSTRAAAMALARAIHGDFIYDGDATESDTPAIDAFRLRRGVCQDFATILLIALRSFGIPAAYVSGYLRTLPPPGKPRLVGVDATHAWVNVWCGPDAGWVGIDPTNACFAGINHIFTAMGRDYADVAPLDGIFIGRPGQQQTVSVDVTPIEL